MPENFFLLAPKPVCACVRAYVCVCACVRARDKCGEALCVKWPRNVCCSVQKLHRVHMHAPVPPQCMQHAHAAPQDCGRLPGHPAPDSAALQSWMQEMNTPTPGRTLTQHRKIAVNFRDTALLKVRAAACTCEVHLMLVTSGGDGSQHTAMGKYCDCSHIMHPMSSRPQWALGVV